MAVMNSADVYSLIGEKLGISPIAVIVIFLIVGIWTLIWKGMALWKSSKKNQLVWFILLLLINTVGILEILYIYIFSEMGKSKKSNSEIVKIKSKTKKKKR